MTDFQVLVKEMRTAQKNYFKTREVYWLQESKKLEKRVDTFLENIDAPEIEFP